MLVCLCFVFVDKTESSETAFLDYFGNFLYNFENKTPLLFWRIFVGSGNSDQMNTRLSFSVFNGNFSFCLKLENGGVAKS